MLKATKVRIYPTAEQVSQLSKDFGATRWLWNQSLSLMSQTYKETGKGVSAYDMKKRIPALKQEFEWLKETYSQCLQQAVLHLSQAFINFFEGRAKYPTFKSKFARQSVQYPQNVKMLDGVAIKFPGNLGTVRAKLHRALPTGAIKTVTVSKTPDERYYASLLIDDGKAMPESSSDGKAVGLDLGLIDFVVTSDGSKFHNPKHLQKHAKNLKRKQQKLSRKQKGSKTRCKARRLVAKVHSKIARVREDFLHKLSRKLVNENQVVVVENLAVKNMVKNHTLAKAISDAGWGKFCTMLKYKAEFDGKTYLEIDRFFPSSHLCSNTLLSLPKLALSVRSFLCPHCGQRHDRDVNAAINIKNEGLRLLALGISATANRGSVNPKGAGRKKAMHSEVASVEVGSPRSIA
ncbi:IS200/IS605 family element transposase accessory protein TnpB [Phormidium sp. FACHB-592]|uniref:Transposase n=1 Tax=Stenomitos frigidus AS-A4 TaxID=2933935 RepID=A0ABV0KRZ3_9CYAN|nr:MULTISPECIES: RNA-guided endonuclease TnpB family protein [Cyanophyceae]MBD2035312.1 IS200/IS605 family element transposase accessory protein TnpB [Leptolyngbya sp. FACHB-321]MBD2073909.1 IS200/IS605 family element transposase accessory protein TnpB [Phormidium sp. FACHB-592]